MFRLHRTMLIPSISTPDMVDGPVWIRTWRDWTFQGIRNILCTKNHVYLGGAFKPDWKRTLSNCTEEYVQPVASLRQWNWDKDKSTTDHKYSKTSSVVYTFSLFVSDLTGMQVIAKASRLDVPCLYENESLQNDVFFPISDEVLDVLKRVLPVRSTERLKCLNCIEVDLHSHAHWTEAPIFRQVLWPNLQNNTQSLLDNKDFPQTFL